MRNWIIGIIVVAILGGIGFFFFSRSGNGGPDPGVAEAGEIVTAFTGDLAANVTAAGTLIAQREATLSLETNGTVSLVNVGIGDAVQAGDVLVQLDTAALERAIANAEQSLAIQESNLAKLVDPPAAYDVASAEAAVDSAEIKLADLLDGPSSEEIAASEASIDAARLDLASAQSSFADSFSGGTTDEVLAAQRALELAQEAYTTAEERHRATFDCEWNNETQAFDCVGGSDREIAARGPAQQAYADLLAAEERLARLQPGGNTSAVASSGSTVSSRQASVEAAELRHERLLLGATEQEIAAAESEVAQAKANLERLVNPDNSDQITQQEIAVEQAKISLVQAQNNLEKATLVAPFNGIITSLDVTEGEFGTGPVISMVDMDSMEVVLDVDELDISAVSIGQPAQITFEAYRQQGIRGEIIAIAPENTSNTSGTVNYAVNIALSQADIDEAGIALLNGLTAEAQLITEEVRDVLLIPNETIRADRAAGRYYVNLVEGEDDEGQPLASEVEITIGLRDSENTQVTSGLNNGDELLVGEAGLPVFEFGSGPPPGAGED